MGFGQNNSIGLGTKVIASAVYRGINLLYSAFPSERTLRLLLHLNKYVEQATWMVVCRHFDESPARNDALMRVSQEFLRAHISREDTVLDVGCHQGHLTRYIASLCRRVVGIDTDERLLAGARRLGTPSNAEFRVQDVRTLGAGERFDAVWLHHVLEHIEDVEGVLSTLARVSSAALIEVPDIEQSWTQFLLRDLGGDYFSDATHVREYDRSLIQKHLNRAGWNVVELRQISRVLQVVARI
jgi:2-polyprenyl-3-methyl-5-hydroxy-6-metoxy-1,4-benzoquinol methylase